MGLYISIAHLSRPKSGETENGDGWIVRTAHGMTLFGVIDAVGHGPHAALATRAALKFLETVKLDAGIRPAIDGLHHALAATRGAAATLCLFDGQTLRGAGVGNVTLSCAGTTVPAVLSPGIIGHRIPKLRTFEATLALGDRLAFFSDGVSGRFDLSRTRGLSTADACAAIMKQASVPHDDATVLIADVIPHPAPS